MIRTLAFLLVLTATVIPQGLAASYEKYFPHVIKVETVKKIPSAFLGKLTSIVNAAERKEVIQRKLENIGAACGYVHVGATGFEGYMNEFTRERRLIYEAGERLHLNGSTSRIAGILRCRISDVSKLKYFYSDGSEIIVSQPWGVFLVVGDDEITKAIRITVLPGKM